MGRIVVRPLPPPSAMNRVRTELVQRRARRKVILEHQIRDVCRITKTELAARTGVDLSYISRIISGARVPSLDTSIRLARALGMTLQEWADVIIPPEQLAMIDEIMRPYTDGTVPARKNWQRTSPRTMARKRIVREREIASGIATRRK